MHTLHRASLLERTIFRIVLFAFAVVSLLMLTGGSAFADDGLNSDVGVTSRAWDLTLNAGTWQFVNLLIVPILVGLITRAKAPAKVKVFFSLLFSGLSALLASFVVGVDGSASLSSSTATMWIVSFVITLAGHYGIYKPLDITGEDATSKLTLPNRGVGK